VKQQVEPEPKPQVEQKKIPQEQIKINHEDNGDLMKKKIRRGGRVRHPTLIRDAKMMRKNQIEKRNLAHIKCFKYGDIGHFASGCPTKLRNKDQATHERQGNGKHNLSKEEKAQVKRMCLRELTTHLPMCPRAGNTAKARPNRSRCDTAGKQRSSLLAAL
jgi:hypothetical protein